MSPWQVATMDGGIQGDFRTKKEALASLPVCVLRVKRLGTGFYEVTDTASEHDTTYWVGTQEKIEQQGFTYPSPEEPHS